MMKYQWLENSFGIKVIKDSKKSLEQRKTGGLHVIAVGDFYQMAPIKGSYVFKEDDKDYGPLATNLWKKHMQIYTLTEIMHQRGEKQFCEVLNRLRIGYLIESDNSIFESRIVKRTDDNYVSNARHFLPLNKTTRNYNDNIYAAIVF